MAQVDPQQAMAEILQATIPAGGVVLQTARILKVSPRTFYRVLHQLGWADFDAALAALGVSRWPGPPRKSPDASEVATPVATPDRPETPVVSQVVATPVATTAPRMS